MSLRLRLTLLLALAVSAALLVAWVLTRRAVIAPFTEEVVAAHLDQAVYVAGEIERGADPRTLSEKLGVQIRQRPRMPRFMLERNRGRGGRPPCRALEHRGRDVVLCPGPRNPAAVRLADGFGWVIVHRDLDVDAPRERFGIVLAAVALVIFGLAAVVAARITRPLQATMGAMQRMAAGDLGHRLPESGGKELEEVARAFNRMADRIDDMLRAEKEMMAGISHELRTPLARLRLELEILRDLEVSPRRLDAMEEDVEEVDHLIGELLELSRLSLGARGVDAQRVDLRAVVDEALERHPLPSLEVEVSGEAAPARGDHPRLVRVVGNLLQNAGKYAPAGSRVRVRVEGTRVEVTDDGPGVPDDDLARLFEPFYRGAVSKKTSATGYGLGLMYARQVVELCGGHIEARRPAGGGLTIRFELPPG